MQKSSDIHKLAKSRSERANCAILRHHSNMSNQPYRRICHIWGDSFVELRLF